MVSERTSISGRTAREERTTHFASTIDEVRVYDRALTASEIEALTLESPVSAF
jgi:hypothetical protein